MDILTPGKQRKSITPYVLKHIIPFAFTVTGIDGFHSLSKSLQGRQWGMDFLNEGESELFEHIKRLMSNSDDNQVETICTLLTRKEKDAQIVDKTGTAVASIREYELFLFQTGIAFLVTDYQLAGVRDTRHFLDLSNLLKSYSAAKTNGLSVLKKGKRRLPLTLDDFSKNEAAAVPMRVENQKDMILLLDPKYKNDAEYMDKVLIRSPNKAQRIQREHGNAHEPLNPHEPLDPYNPQDPHILQGSHILYELVYTEQSKTDLCKHLLQVLAGMEITTFFNQFSVTLQDAENADTTLINNGSTAINDNPIPIGPRQAIMPHKALIFAHLCVIGNQDGSEAEQAYYALANRLGKGYDQEYQIGGLPANDDERLAYINSPFPNVLWYISREGMSNVVVVKDSSQQSEDGELFLKGDFSHRFNRSYLFMYILGLHQYYGLIHYAMEAAKLPSRVRDYLSANKDKAQENFAKLEALREEVTFFYLKCVYTEVSHISHQAQIYHRLLKILGIRDMLDEIEKEMIRVSDLASQVRTNEEKKEEARKKKQGDLWTVIGSFYAAVGLFGGMWSIVDRYVMSFLNVQGIERNWMILWMSTGLFLLLSLIAVSIIQHRKRTLGKDKGH